MSASLAMDAAAPNRSNHAYQALSQMIRQRQLKGGEVIIESRLADLLGSSRTPLREALQRLEGEGLVVKAANRSFTVRHVDFAEYMHSLKVRELLEVEAAGLAAGHVPPAAIAAAQAEIDALRAAPLYLTEAHWHSDDTVHHLFIDHCGNPVLAQHVRMLRATTKLFESTRLADRADPDSTEHLVIVAALAEGDAKSARRAVQAHLRSLQRFALVTIGHAR